MQKPFASSHNKKKDNNQFKNNKQAEVLENQTARSSDIQGVKETFIQTGRRDGDGQLSREDTWQGGDCAGEAGLAKGETKDSKSLPVKYCGG